MRTFVIICVVALITIAQLALGQTKSICVPIKINTSSVNPASIPASQISGMSNRGRGSYTASFNLCSKGALNGCRKQTGFVGLSNGTGCVVTFDKPMQRPTPSKRGFSVSYGSSTSKGTYVQVRVMCSMSGGAALTSKSRKFASRSPNKRGGTTYYMVVYSSIACARGPAPPTPGGDSCRAVTIMGQSVDPRKWAPAFLTLDIGFTGQWSWLFSPCNNNPTPPSWVPKCKSSGYITKYSAGQISEQCQNVTFGKMLSFRVARNQIYIRYGGGRSNAKDQARVRIGCLSGAPQLTSPSGVYTKSNGTSGTVYTFDLGISAMCGAVPTPGPGPSGSMSYSSASGSVMPPSGSSLPFPPTSGSDLPSSGANFPSGNSMPSSMSLPSFPSMSGSGSYPSSGSQPSSMPSA